MNTTELVVEIRPKKKIQAHTHKHYWSYVLIDPIFSLTLSSYWSYILTGPKILLILYSHWSYVPTNPKYPWSYTPTYSKLPMILCSYLNLFPVDLVFLLILRCQWFHYSSDYGVTPNWVYDVAASSHSIHFLPCIQLLFIESWKWQSSIYFLSDYDLHSKFAFRNVAALLTIN